MGVGGVHGELEVTHLACWGVWGPRLGTVIVVVKPGLGASGFQMSESAFPGDC